MAALTNGAAQVFSNTISAAMVPGCITSTAVLTSSSWINPDWAPSTTVNPPTPAEVTHVTSTPEYDPSSAFADHQDVVEADHVPSDEVHDRVGTCLGVRVFGNSNNTKSIGPQAV